MSGWDKHPDYGVQVGWLSIVLSVVVFVAISFAVSMCATRANGQTAVLSGVPSITDGDTIRLEDVRIRFNGIDAPEHGAMCGDADMGQRATDALTSYLAGRAVSCSVTGQDRYGRDVATCMLGGEDIAAHMVRVGWARDWPRYSHGRYAVEERQARAEHAGVWAQDCPGLWGNRNYSPN